MRRFLIDALRFEGPADHRLCSILLKPGQQTAGGGGGVASVRGLFPITSSGGANPQIAIVQPLPAATKIYYVNGAGNDATGNGTILLPYATIAKAISVATNGENAIIEVGPGTYSANLALKSGITIQGACQTTGNLADLSTQITGALSYDAGYVAGDYAYFESVEFPNAVTLNGSAATHNPGFVRCALISPATIDGAEDLYLDGTIFSDTVSVTDSTSVFSRLNSYEGGLVTATATTVDCTWDSEQDRYLFGVTVVATGANTFGFSGSGFLDGPVTLDGANASFEGDASFGGTSLVLAGGATAAQYTLVGGGNGLAGGTLLATGTGFITWGGNIIQQNGQSVSFLKTGETVANNSRLNFCGDAAQSYLGFRYSGTNYVGLQTDGAGTIILGDSAVLGLELLGPTGSFISISSTECFVDTNILRCISSTNLTASLQVAMNGFDLGGGLGVFALSIAGTAPTTAPATSVVVWQDAIGTHAGPPNATAADFVDYMLAPVLQGTPNTQASIKREYLGEVSTVGNPAPATAIITIPVPTNEVIGIEVTLTGRITSGVHTGDCFTTFQVLCFKNVAGTVTQSANVATAMTSEDASFAGFGSSVVGRVSGTNAIIGVNAGSAGAPNIDWTARATVVVN